MEVPVTEMTSHTVRGQVVALLAARIGARLIVCRAGAERSCQVEVWNVRILSATVRSTGRDRRPLTQQARRTSAARVSRLARDLTRRRRLNRRTTRCRRLLDIHVRWRKQKVRRARVGFTAQRICPMPESTSCLAPQCVSCLTRDRRTRLTGRRSFARRFGGAQIINRGIGVAWFGRARRVHGPPRSQRAGDEICWSRDISILTTELTHRLVRSLGALKRS